MAQKDEYTQFVIVAAKILTNDKLKTFNDNSLSKMLANFSDENGYYAKAVKYFFAEKVAYLSKLEELNKSKPSVLAKAEEKEKFSNQAKALRRDFTIRFEQVYDTFKSVDPASVKGICDKVEEVYNMNLKCDNIPIWYLPSENENLLFRQILRASQCGFPFFENGDINASFYSAYANYVRSHKLVDNVNMEKNIMGDLAFYNEDDYALAQYILSNHYMSVENARSLADKKRKEEEEKAALDARFEEQRKQREQELSELKATNAEIQKKYESLFIKFKEEILDNFDQLKSDKKQYQTKLQDFVEAFADVKTELVDFATLQKKHNVAPVETDAKIVQSLCAASYSNRLAQNIDKSEEFAVPSEHYTLKNDYNATEAIDKVGILYEKICHELSDGITPDRNGEKKLFTESGLAAVEDDRRRLSALYDIIMSQKQKQPQLNTNFIDATMTGLNVMVTELRNKSKDASSTKGE